VTFWKMLELHAKDYRRVSEDDLVSVPVNEWPAVRWGRWDRCSSWGTAARLAQLLGTRPDACPMVWLTPKIYYTYLQNTLRFLSEREVRPRLYREEATPVALLRTQTRRVRRGGPGHPVMKWMLNALPMSRRPRLSRGVLEEAR
jgi:hypothetical protein